MNALIFGGASSGKSQLAEHLCNSLGGNLVYLACMPPVGAEAQERIRRHRAQRAGFGFHTIECAAGFDAALADGRTLGATVLLEDLGNTVANRLFDAAGYADPAPVCTAILADLEKFAHRCKHVIVVGNDVGCDGIDYDIDTTTYQRLLGRITNRWAARCDLVAECTAGIPQALLIGGDNRDELRA